jgi:hypothetical protein
MKKILLFLLMLICISYININGQTRTNNATVTFGPEIKTQSKVILDRIVSARPQQYLCIGNELVNFSYKTNVIIANAGKDLRIRNILPLTFQGIGDIEELNFLDICDVKGNIYVFAIINDKKDKTMSLYMLSLDQEELIASAPKKLGVVNYDFTRATNVKKFELTLSPDSSKILIFYPAPYKKGMPERFGAMVFDENMNRIWANEFQLPYPDNYFKVNKFFVGNNGQIFMNCIKYKGNQNAFAAQNPNNYQFVLLATDPNGQEIKEIDIDIKDKYVSDMVAASLPDNDIVCIGYTSPKSLSNKIDGFFYALIDHNTLELKQIKQQLFEPRFISEGFSDSKTKNIEAQAEKGKELTLENFYFNSIVVKADGSVIAFSEQINKNNDQDYIYYFDDIIIINYLPSGEFNYILKIPKRQHINAGDKSLLSYIYSVVDNKIYVLFNDNVNNLVTPNPVPPKVFTNVPQLSINNWGVALCTIDDNGSLSKELLFAYKDIDKFYFLPNKSKVMPDKNIALLLTKTSSLSSLSYKLAIIKFK